MDRRDTIKTMLIGSLSGGLVLTACTQADEELKTSEASGDGLYGRTPKEKAHDEQLKAEIYFQPHEIATLAVLCDLILPSSSTADAATAAGVPDFIEFMTKEIKSHQLSLRGGLMWLDHQAMTMFQNAFKDCAPAQQHQLLDEIAWPDTAAPEVQQGVSFFSLLRNLVVTGYYTSPAGIKDLGYQGNVPNIWDGVPEDVLAAHGMAYEPEWLAKCVNQEQREEMAKWDEHGNLLN